MEKEPQKLIEILKIIIILFIIIIVICFSIVYIENKKNESKISNEQIEVENEKQQKEKAKETAETVIIDKLSKMQERDRIEYYFSSFVNAIESQNYDIAYEMLYDEFKNNYFPTLEDFENYAKKTFPKLMSVEYTNFERNGEIYVLFINISNSLSTSDTTKEMNIVIKENDINDFVMSFSVI